MKVGNKYKHKEGNSWIEIVQQYGESSWTDPDWDKSRKDVWCVDEHIHISFYPDNGEYVNKRGMHMMGVLGHKGNTTKTEKEIKENYELMSEKEITEERK